MQQSRWKSSTDTHCAVSSRVALMSQITAHIVLSDTGCIRRCNPPFVPLKQRFQLKWSSLLASFVDTMLSSYMKWKGLYIRWQSREVYWISFKGNERCSFYFIRLDLKLLKNDLENKFLKILYRFVLGIQVWSCLKQPHELRYFILNLG